MYNDTIVYIKSFDELRKSIKKSTAANSGVIFQLTEDIQSDPTPINVPIDFSFIIDGKKVMEPVISLTMKVSIKVGQHQILIIIILTVTKML